MAFTLTPHIHVSSAVILCSEEQICLLDKELMLISMYKRKLFLCGLCQRLVLQNDHYSLETWGSSLLEVSLRINIASILIIVIIERISVDYND